MKTSDIVTALREIYENCNTIEMLGACEKCPFYNGCFKTTDFIEMCETITEEEIDELAEFADDVVHPITDEDILAYYADMARKAERDEYYD